MGQVVSFLTTIRAAIKSLLQLSRLYDDLLRRISESPGIPTYPSTLSYWQIPSGSDPALPPNTHDTPLPAHADVVIIGSGISGCFVARTLLSHRTEKPLKILMLEARDVCSGATGRNGGHIKPDPYHNYERWKRRSGAETARKLVRFGMSHVDEILDASEVVGGEGETEVRSVETVDAYFDEGMWGKARGWLEEWKRDMPAESEGFEIHEASEAREKFGLSSLCVGAISGGAGAAGAAHPYRLVTRTLAHLSQEFPENFTLATLTPCTSIEAPTATNHFYKVNTPRGNLKTPHVVHATNAFAGHLVPAFTSKIFPVRATMTSQRHQGLFLHQNYPLSTTPPSEQQDVSPKPGGRSLSLIYKQGYDYLTQRPKCGTLMLGGAWAQAADQGMAEVGISTDDGFDVTVASHLARALDVMFDSRPIAEATSEEEGEHAEDGGNDNGRRYGRVKAIWSGILGMSADGLPWVGPIPTKLTSRPRPPLTSTPSRKTSDSEGKAIELTAPPSEWVCAGYSGEGMVNAPLCAKALALMVLGVEGEGGLGSWFPDEMRVTERRLKKASPDSLLDDL